MQDSSILVCFFVGRVELLIPKKRGHGFLKVPLGHHYNGLARVCANLGYDAYGLDGSLEIEIGSSHSIADKNRPEFLRRVVRPIARHLGFPFRVVEQDEYWSNHPTYSLQIRRESIESK
jgi:hypothetical protein